MIVEYNIVVHHSDLARLPFLNIYAAMDYLPT